MRLKILPWLAVLGVACAVARANESSVSGAAPAASAASVPKKGGPDLSGHFKNLKVLPSDISKHDLMAAMHAMDDGLGVRCNYCHVMEPKKDFAADTGHKDNARGMLRLTARIDKELFTWPKAPKATCYMCHHGNEDPPMQPPPSAGPHGGAAPGSSTPPPRAP